MRSYVGYPNDIKCALIMSYALNSGVRLLTRLYGIIYDITKIFTYTIAYVQDMN